MRVLGPVLAFWSGVTFFSGLIRFGFSNGTLSSGSMQQTTDGGPEDTLHDLPVDLITGDQPLEYSLAGSIWIEKEINHKAFLTVMRNAWDPRGGMEAIKIAPNRFLFKFKD